MIINVYYVGYNQQYLLVANGWKKFDSTSVTLHSNYCSPRHLISFAVSLWPYGPELLFRLRLWTRIREWVGVMDQGYGSYGPGLWKLWTRVGVWVGVMDQGYEGYGPGLGYGLEVWTRVRVWVGVKNSYIFTTTHRIQTPEVSKYLQWHPLVYMNGVSKKK